MSGLEGGRAAGREECPDSAQTRLSNTALAWGSTRRLSIGPHGEAAAGRDSQEDPGAALVCFIRDSSSDESSDESCCTTAPTPCPLETVSSAGHLVGPDSSDPAQRPGTGRRSSTTRSGGVLATYSAGGPHNRESSSGHRHHHACHGEGKKRQTFLRRLSPWICMPNTKKKWITFTLFWVVVGGGVVFGLLYGFTKFVDTVIEPTTESAQEKLNQWQFASVLCAVRGATRQTGRAGKQRGCEGRQRGQNDAARGAPPTQFAYRNAPAMDLQQDNDQALLYTSQPKWNPHPC